MKKKEAAQAAKDADARWMRLALQAVYEYSGTKRPFTTDDIWKRLDVWDVDPPAEPRAMGTVIMSAKRKGWVRPEGYRPSKRRVCHARQIPVYRGVRLK